MIGTPTPHYHQLLLWSLDHYVQESDQGWVAIITNSGVGHGKHNYSIGTFETQEAANQAAKLHVAHMRRYYLDQWEYLQSYSYA